jgi:hypothetical protein
MVVTGVVMVDKFNFYVNLANEIYEVTGSMGSGQLSDWLKDQNPRAIDIALSIMEVIRDKGSYTDLAPRISSVRQLMHELYQ